MRLITTVVLILVLTAFTNLTAAFGAPTTETPEEKTGDKYIGLATTETVKQQAAASELDKLEHEWRLTRINTRFRESIIVSSVAVLSLLIVLSFMTRSGRRFSGTDIVNVSGLVFIIFGTIVLVIIADVDEQLTASIGILGAIAGYLFGRSSAAGTSGSTSASEGQPQGGN